MKTSFLVLLLLSCMDGFSQMNARVVRVKDGDTFVALWNAKLHNVRINHVDAPELKQNYGLAALDSLNHLINGKIVQLDSVKIDLYGREIANVYVNGLRLDSIMIAKGWAWHYTEYSKDVMLENCMIKACNQGVGLWRCGKDKVLAPWIYRRLKRK